MPNPILLRAEQFPSGIPWMLRNDVQHDQPNRQRSPGHVIHPRLRGRLERLISRQALRVAGRDRVSACDS